MKPGPCGQLVWPNCRAPAHSAPSLSRADENAVQDPADHAHEERPEYSPPETVDRETGHQRRSQREAEGIQHEYEQAQRDERERKRQKKEDRTDDRVDEPKDGTRDESREWTADVETGQ